MGLRGASGWREERRRGGGRGASRWVAAPRGAVTAGSSAPARRRHAGPAPATWAREPRRVPPAPLAPTRPRGPPLPGGAGRLPLRRWRFSVDRGGRAGGLEGGLTDTFGGRRFPGRRLVVTPAATSEPRGFQLFGQSGRGRAHASAGAVAAQRVLSQPGHICLEAEKVPAFSSLLCQPGSGPGGRRWQIRQRGDSLWIGWGGFCFYFSCGGTFFFFLTLHRDFIFKLPVPRIAARDNSHSTSLF